MATNTRNGYVESLGDALGKALRRCSKAKEKYGLQALLLHEVDLEKEI